ncbi:MAG: hypothetical protein ACOC0U_08205 [Desulfovibrionales bacterium]
MLPGLDYPLWYYAVASLTLFISLPLFGGPVVSLISEIYGAASKKILATKFAQHCDRFSTWVLLLALVLSFLSFFFLVPATRWYPIPFRISDQTLSILAGAGGLALIFWILRTATWKPLKKKKGLHITFGVVQVIALLSLLLAAISIKARLLILSPGESLQLDFPTLMGWEGDSLFWPVLIQIFLKTIGLAGAAVLPYLLWRRNKDDFGRDYYNWSVSTASKWAVIFLLGQLLILPWYYLLGLLRTEWIAYAAGGAIVALFLAAAVWLLLIRSRTPLRYKGMMIFALVFVWASLTLQLMIADGFLPSILMQIG